MGTSLLLVSEDTFGRQNMTADVVVGGSIKLWGPNFPDPRSDLLMAYLPLTHILEQVRLNYRMNAELTK